MKSSTYYFQTKPKIFSDFQICISVPLRRMGRRASYNFVTKIHFLRVLLQIKKPPLFRPFFHFYIESSGESRLSPPSFGNIPGNEVEKIRVLD